MLYFKKLVKEVAEDKSVRAAQLERLVAMKKFSDAVKIATNLTKSILRDVGITDFELVNKGYAKDREDFVVFEIVVNIPENTTYSDKILRKSAKEILGSNIKFDMHVSSNLSFYFSVPTGS